MAPFRRDVQGLPRLPAPRLRPAVQELIGRRLRLHYEDLQQQPLPGRLSELLDRLDRLDRRDPAEAACEPPRRN